MILQLAPLQVDRVHVWWLKFKRNVGRVKQQFRDKKMQDMIDARDILTQLLADHDKQYIIGMDIAIMKSRVWRRCIDRVKRKLQMVLLQRRARSHRSKVRYTHFSTLRVMCFINVHQLTIDFTINCDSMLRNRLSKENTPVRNTHCECRR